MMMVWLKIARPCSWWIRLLLGIDIFDPKEEGSGEMVGRKKTRAEPGSRSTLCECKKQEREREIKEPTKS